VVGGLKYVQAVNFTGLHAYVKYRQSHARLKHSMAGTGTRL